MSLTVLTVSKYGSTSAYFVVHAFANACARSRSARSIAGVDGTLGGRTVAKCLGRQFRAGLLLPTPRGSKPTTSYWAATLFGSSRATKPASDRPLPPGPPGFTRSGPCDVFAVCRTRDRASVICSPPGRS